MQAVSTNRTLTVGNDLAAAHARQGQLDVSDVLRNQSTLNHIDDRFQFILPRVLEYEANRLGFV